MDAKYMEMALIEAQKAFDEDETPVGAVIVKEGIVIGRGSNRREQTQNALTHAELIALNQAFEAVGSWRLYGCDIYVTLEPCPMCAGALIQSRVDNIYFGAYDPKAGCCGSLYNLPEDARFNHRCGIIGGIMEGECAEKLSSFFKKLRS